MRTIGEDELRELVGGLCGRDLSGVSPDLDLVDALALDSLGRLQLLAGIEKRLARRIPDGRLAGLRTLRQLQEALSESEPEPGGGA